MQTPLESPRDTPQSQPQASIPRISRQQFNELGLFETLIDVFDEEPNSLVLLDNINFPNARSLIFNDARDFWSTVFNDIENNSNDFSHLLTEALRMYPYNPHFSTVQNQHGITETPIQHDIRETPIKSGISVLFRNYSGETSTLQSLLLQVLQRLQLGNNIEQIYASNGVAAFYLLGANIEQADNLIQALQLEDNSLNVCCFPFRDYLITQIFVEGPDQARFDLRNIPASTPSAEIARAVMSQYHEQMWPENRQAVIDYVQADGNNQRLRPSSTLHDNGINENGTLHVSPERTAGSINPILREQALIRVKRQIQEFAKGYPDFKIEANSLQVPTEYTLSFDAPSWSPPIESYGSPQTIDHHQVWIVLLPDFPMKAPLVRWQTDIFHPNIQPRNGQVCLGILAENYRPALDFKELCQMLVDIASFQNYAISGGYLNREAKDWATSEAGQAAIQARGGRALEQSTAATSTHNEQGHCLRIKRREM